MKAFFGGSSRSSRNGKHPLLKLDGGMAYEGEWLKGKAHGRGIMTWAHGDSYEGDWVKDKKHGRGIFIWADGDRYEGDHLNGKMHGRGIHTWSDGNRYDGQCQEDKMHGRGVFTSAQRGWTYSGALDMDRPTEGELVEADGRRFKVTYAEDCSWIGSNPNAKTKEEMAAPSAKAAAAKDLLKQEFDTHAKQAEAASPAATKAAAAKEAAAAAFFSKTAAKAAVAKAKNKESEAAAEAPSGGASPSFGRRVVSGLYMAVRGGGASGGGGAATSLDEKKNAVKVWLRENSLEQYADGVVDFGYDSMDALWQANEKEIIETTEDASIGMKKPHRKLFLNAWKALPKPSLSPQRTFASKEEEFENMIADYDPSLGMLSKDYFAKICRAIQNGSNPFESPVGAGKFCTEPKEMKMGGFQQAAGGLFKLMNVNKNETVAKVLGGVPAVKEEVEKLKTNKKYSKYYAVVSKYLNYILYEPASEQAYPNGIRDKGHAGKTLSYFAEHPFAKEADLDEAEVVALRLYTTPAFVAINEPLRNMEEGVEHPLPVLVTILAEAIRKLRQIGSHDMAAVSEKVLWRGMKNLQPSDEFKTRGGTELAPMSTTTDIKTAVEYSLSSESLIFMIVTKNALQRGASLSWLSAFPTEDEICFSPLTYLQPTGRKQVVEINGMRFTIVEVAPSN